MLRPFVLLPLLWTGCIAGAGYSLKDRVTEAAREYNEGVRWGRLEQAASHIAVDERERFWSRHKALEEELEIADSEMVQLNVDGKREEATARMEYQWSLKRRGLVEKTTTEQKWVRKGGEWVVASETRVSGAPLVLFAEPHGHAPSPATAAIR
jgi:hypothetical protein